MARRKYSKRRRRQRRKPQYPLTRKSPMPTKFCTKLRYHTTRSIDPAIGTAGVHVFIANGLYDPDITGTGHQPRGYDQIQPMYDHYVVILSDFTAQIANSVGNTQAQMLGVSVRDAPTPEADVNDYQEGGTVRSTVIPADPSATRTLKYKLNPNRFLGRSKPLSDPQLKGSVTANPTEQVYYHLWCQSVDESLNAGKLIASIFIDYTVVFIEPRVSPQS